MQTRCLTVSVLLFFLASTSFAQSARPGLALGDGTPVKLRLLRTVSSADTRVGDAVDFTVVEAVSVDNLVVISKGAVAWATISEAKRSRSLGRAGKLKVKLDYVQLADGGKVPLRAVRDAKGDSKTGTAIAESAATLFIFLPFALSKHGHEIAIGEGTEITAYSIGNVPIDAAKFATQPPGKRVAAEVVSGGQTATFEATAEQTSETVLDISSTPLSAEIELDGNFVGSTPSMLSASMGEHTIRITRKGYKPWERKVKTTSGKVSIAAELEQETTAPQSQQ